MSMRIIGRSVVVSVTVTMVGTTQKPRAHNVNRKPDHGNGNGFAEVNSNRCEEAHNGFVANQECNHRQNNGARKCSEIAQLTGTEYKASVIGVFARIHVGER